MLVSTLLDRLSASSTGKCFGNSITCLLGTSVSSQSWGLAEVFGFLWCLSQCNTCLEVHQLMMLKYSSFHFNPVKRDNEWKWKEGRTDREEKYSRYWKKSQMVTQRVKVIKSLRKRGWWSFSSRYFYRFIASLLFPWRSSIPFHTLCMHPLFPHKLLNYLTPVSFISMNASAGEEENLFLFGNGGEDVAQADNM